MLVALGLAHSGNCKSIQNCAASWVWGILAYGFVLGGLLLLSLLLSMHGCAGSSRPEQTDSANPNFMLIVNCI